MAVLVPIDYFGSDGIAVFSGGIAVFVAINTHVAPLLDEARLGFEIPSRIQSIQSMLRTHAEPSTGLQGNHNMDDIGPGRLPIVAIWRLRGVVKTDRKYT